MKAIAIIFVCVLILVGFGYQFPSEAQELLKLFLDSAKIAFQWVADFVLRSTLYVWGFNIVVTLVAFCYFNFNHADDGAEVPYAAALLLLVVGYFSCNPSAADFMNSLGARVLLSLLALSIVILLLLFKDEKMPSHIPVTFAVIVGCLEFGNLLMLLQKQRTIQSFAWDGPVTAFIACMATVASVLGFRRSLSNDDPSVFYTGIRWVNLLITSVVCGILVLHRLGQF
jgi:hypothetical protein